LGEGNKVAFIRTDHWLPNLKLELMSPTPAQLAILRKFLRAYGPATLSDFSHWSGIPMQQVKPLRALLDSEMVEIPGEKKTGFLLREDLDVLNGSPVTTASIRLLPNFDSFLLAHREKDHLLAEKHYKRVYRNQGWISPVVLIGGAIAGVWSYKLQGKKLLVNIEPFGKPSKTQRVGIEQEAESLALFFGSELDFHLS
jgi:hypothetical protein